ncbi:ABC transporter permease [Streptomyces sp. NPDC020379]|uniref:ABC transporter permease n=1 Tax=Streptomyces sp. NPDC020379 TaxID=3365071 RepID=UPI0037B109FF
MTRTHDERPGHGPADRPTGPTGLTAWARDLATGARFALTGGREGWLRTGLTAVGVGIGVVLLLIAASVPEMLSQRDERQAARDVTSSTAGGPRADTLLYQSVGTDYRDKPVSGALLRAEGPKAPAPPGVDRIPGAGEMVVSPALDRLLKSDEGKLLRERFRYRAVGTIGDAGLIGPSELFFYIGSDHLSTDNPAVRYGQGERVLRVNRYGSDQDDPPLSPALLLLVVMVCVVLLLPVAVFIATAVRFGGDHRDRRLAALRLVGADIKAVRRIAAGEALCAALIGLAVGTGLFLSARRFASGITIQDTSVFPADLAPAPAPAALVAVAVPALAVVTTLLALRGVAIEPLGIVRNAVARRRRLWWRLLLPAVGLVLLVPLSGSVSLYGYGGTVPTVRVAVGAVLVLVGVTALLPWLVEACVARLRGGPLPWQLAVRRLQLSGGSAARAVSGITVAVAGAIAVQMLFAGTQNDYVGKPDEVPATHSRIQAMYRTGTAAEVRGWQERLRATEGVTGAVATVESYADAHGGEGRGGVATVRVADCATLRELARLDSCADGDVFVAQEPDGDVPTARNFPPGTPLEMARWDSSGGSEKAYRWTVPASARVVATRPDPTGEHRFGVLATPSAIDVRAMPEGRTVASVKFRQGDLDAIERVRNTAAGIDPAVRVWRMGGVVKDDHYAAIQRGLLVGGTLTLFLIGGSMLVTTLEQLRERSRLLSALVALGTRRSTIGWSVLWQTAVPVVLGMILAVAGGLGLGWTMLRLIDRRVKDWLSFLPLVGAGTAVILLVTLLSLPPLWRMMRTNGLRTE